MTDDAVSGDDSRRSFIKKSAFATSALALGATGSVGAQQDGDGTTPTGDGGGEGIIQVSSFNPRARFSFVSGVVDWAPTVPEVSDDVWDSYNTYQIRWLNTNQIVPFWVGQDANLGEYDENLGFIPDDEEPNQPQLFEMDEEWELFDEGNDLVEVSFSAVPEDEEDAILENDDWWQDQPDETGTPTVTETPANESGS